MNTNELQLASMRSRAFAYVVDDFLITILVMVAFWENIITLSNNPDAMMEFIKNDLVMPLILIKIVYQTFFIWYYGATIGKIVAKIRVIDANEWNRVSVFNSFLRAVGRIVSEMFFYIGFLIGFFNEGRKTFHDITGKTLVVNA